MQEPQAEHNAPPAPPPLFEATLYPHRSLPWPGFRWLMALAAALLLIRGGTMAAAGAWPVMVFCALGFLLLYFAFRLNYRAGRLIETVRLTRDDLLIRRIHPNGRVEEWRMQPSWVNVDAVPSCEEIGAPLAEIQLSSHGRRIGIGRFLTDDDREDFADALNRALVRARSAPGAP